MHLQNSKYITIIGAARKTEIKSSIIKDWINDGIIECVDGQIKLNDVEKIIIEKNKYISFEEFLNLVKHDRFDESKVSNRNKYIDFLEINDYFGVEIKYPEEMVFPFDNRASFYFLKKNIDTIDAASKEFFKFYGLSEKEKCELIIETCEYKKTRSILLEFMKGIEKYTPSTTEFFKEIVNYDVNKLKDEDLITIDNNLHHVASEQLLFKFKTYINQILNLNLGELERINIPVRARPAYPYYTYVDLAKIIFLEDNIQKKGILQKAFEKSFYYEMWLFLSMHYICGWRIPDKCNAWVQVDESVIKRLNLDTIKEDVLNNKIDNNIYCELGEHIETLIEKEALKCIKTKTGSDLLAPIGKELKDFFGRMTLIAYYHKINSSEGKVLYKRTGEYLNKQNLRKLFGDDIFNVDGRKNLQSLRLTKSFMQANEESAKHNGEGVMAAHVIASYSRNHVNIDTTARYLRDRGLNGETADVVLAMMLDRGVFGCIRYKEFLAAFPDAFESLTVKEQTQLLAECEVSAYEMEMISSYYLVEADLKSDFAEGKIEKVNEKLEEMFMVSQGYGKAKDKGVYCKKRALGEKCKHPIFKSCLANVCPYLVFTEEGIKSLIDVVYFYDEKARKTGNPKYSAILKKIIIPAYKRILFEYSKRMQSDEAKELKKVIGVYNEEHIKKK